MKSKIIAALLLGAAIFACTNIQAGYQDNKIVEISDDSGNLVGTTSNALDVNIKSGSSSGTQYTDAAATPAHPTGTIPVFDNAGTITSVSAANPLPVSATISTAGIATSVKQSDGSQKTQIVDGAGNVIGATTNALDINIKSGNPTTITATQGTATNLKTQAEAYQGGTAVGPANPLQVTLANTGANATAVKVDNSGVTQPVSGTFWQATQPVSLASVPSHDVTNAGTFAVQATEADGANTTLGAKADAKSTATDITPISAMSVLKQISASVQAPPSQAVTNAGTFAVQEATLDGAITANVLQGNVKQINGVAPSMGSGIMGTGVQRVAIASDNDPVTVKQATGTNLHAVLDANSGVDIGKLTANQSVNVAQVNGVTTLMGNGVTGTGSQRVTVASDNTAFSVNPLSATTPVSTMNSASANSGLNSALAGVFDDSTPTSITENNFGFLRMSANRNLYGTIRDAAGNERGANVNASNQLAVAGPVTVASGGIASGALASGSVASGALASGSIASGALASGSIASGALAAGAITNGATSIAENEDVASADADRGVKMLLVRKATPANTSGTDGDYEFGQISAGRIWASSNIDQINGVTPLMGNGTTGTGSPRVTLASDGTAISTTGYMSVKVDQTTPGTTNGVTLVPATSGGLSVANFTSGDSFTALTNTAQVVKASAGQLFGYYIYNPNATAVYVIFYNVAQASVTVGTTNPLIVLCIPATSAANVEFTHGITFSNAGWSIAATTTGGGNTAPTTALEAMVFYK